MVMMLVMKMVEPVAFVMKMVGSLRGRPRFRCHLQWHASDKPFGWQPFCQEDDLAK